MIYSADYYKACAAWVEEIMTSPPRPFGSRPTVKTNPQPATHIDPRMHLALADVRMPGDDGPKVTQPLVSSKS